MLELTDFFKPINFQNLLIFILFIFVCEIAGYSILRRIFENFPGYIRGTVWFIGMGVIVFLYFLLHLFLPFSFPSIILPIGTVIIFSLKYYIANKGYLSLVNFLKRNIIAVLIIICTLPVVAIKVSQPPYVWDEMAYHYISPFTLYNESTWDTSSTSYSMNFPRLMETAYIALFSLTKTYSPARLLHFLIFVSIVFANER